MGSMACKTSGEWTRHNVTYYLRKYIEYDSCRNSCIMG